MDQFDTRKRLPMVCASHEAETRTYKLFRGGGRRWLVACQPNEADNVYVEDRNPNSRGFGGRTLEFTLESGEVVELKGPWHTNAEALYRATGYDCRDKHLGFVILGLTRKDGIISNIIHFDAEPVLGEFSWHRAEKLAKEKVKELGKDVHYYAQSQGGSVTAVVSAEDEEQPDE